MLAIYKKELKSYLTSMQGYVFMAFIMLVLGIYFTAYNLNYASPDFGTTLNSVTFVFLIITPILTMRILAEEKRNKTDQLLFTSPVPIWKIVFGKYLGMVTIYLIPVVITLFYFGKIRNSFLSYDLNCNCWIFLFGMCQYCSWTFFIFDYGKSGYRSGSYLCGIILQFCHEWN